MDDNKAWERFVGNTHVKRAIEIALSGEHSIAFVGNPENGEDLLNKIISNDVVTRFVCPCPCKNLGDRGIECSCDVIQIQAYKKRKQYALAMKSDIVVEIARPRPNDFFSRNSESFDRVMERISEVKKNKEKIETIDSDAVLLFKTAIEKLGFTTKTVGVVRLVAATIAKLDDSKTIQTMHIAEAIQYKYNDQHN